MGNWNLTEADLDEQIARAREAGRDAEEREPRARAIRFDPTSRKFVLDLTNDTTFIFPAERLEGLREGTNDALADVQISLGGEGLHWEKLDVDFSVPGLMVGIFGSKVWMAEIGRHGGSKTSEAKTKAVQENGKKGGRPKKGGSAVGQ